MYYKITELFIKRKYLVEITQPRLIRSAETAETCCKQQNNNLKFFEENRKITFKDGNY